MLWQFGNLDAIKLSNKIAHTKKVVTATTAYMMKRIFNKLETSSQPA